MRRKQKVNKVNITSSDWVWEYDENGGCIEEVNNTEGWREYFNRKEIVESKTGEPYKLLCVSIFADEYQAKKKRNKQVTGIYMKPTNQRKKVPVFHIKVNFCIRITKNTHCV